MLQQFLSSADAERAARTLGKLAGHGNAAWVLTGGLAVEIHRLRFGRQPSHRALSDIDFVVNSFDDITSALAGDFLFRHVHPLEGPGKTLVQMVDPATAVRVDVFRALGGTMARSLGLELPSYSLRLVSLEDLLARTARLAMDLVNGVLIPAKHARDFCRLVDLVEPEQVEAAWAEHRKPSHPETFSEARRQLEALIPAHPELLIDPEYSRDPGAICERCAPRSVFQLAEPKAILELLGYC